LLIQEDNAMQAAHIGNGWKLLIIMLGVLTGLFIVLVSLASPASSRARESEGRPGPVARVQNEKPETSENESAPNILTDFELIPGTAVLVDDHHVVAFYKKSDREFYAVALFQVDCDRTSCTPNQLLAFSIVDGDGQDVQPANQIEVAYPKVSAASI
jgi:hypothetical protein